jgi:predicted transcriptional regulator
MPIASNPDDAALHSLLGSEEVTVEAKEAVRALLDRLPDDCSVEDVLYHLYVLRSIEDGQADATAGRTISHEEVERAMRRKWLRAADA